jgi:hypothetical protein
MRARQLRGWDPFPDGARQKAKRTERTERKRGARWSAKGREIVGNGGEGRKERGCLEERSDERVCCQAIPRKRRGPPLPRTKRFPILGKNYLLFGPILFPFWDKIVINKMIGLDLYTIYSFTLAALNTHTLFSYLSLLFYLLL